LSDLRRLWGHELEGGKLPPWGSSGPLRTGVTMGSVRAATVSVSAGQHVSIGEGRRGCPLAVRSSESTAWAPDRQAHIKKVVSNEASAYCHAPPLTDI